MKRSALIFLIIIHFSLNIFAHSPISISAPQPPNEGLWLPIFISGYTYEQMKSMGLRLSPEQLYSINQPSIKDAVVLFGNAAGSGSIISDKGLLLTNHHCGFPYIVNHSTEKNNYIKEGFWAKSQKEELPNPGLTVTFLVRMENVTEEVLKNIPQQSSELIKNQWIENNLHLLRTKYSEEGKYEVSIKPFYNGIEYYLFVYQIFKDVRLVAAPSTSIGRFGGETDNWQWPRHAADFCIFRIYTAPDGSPAEYDSTNVPMKPKYFLPISTEGVLENDFTLMLGYPNATHRYLSSFEVSNIINKINPAFSEAFDAILPIVKTAIYKDDKVKLGYNCIFNSFANAWKRTRGETNSLKTLNIVEKKQIQEQMIKKWIETDSMRKKKYYNVFSDFDTICRELNGDLLKCYWYGNISVLTSKTLMLPYYLQNCKPRKHQRKFTEAQIEKLKNDYKKYSENINEDLEIKIIIATFDLWKKLPEELRPQIDAYITKLYDGKVSNFAKAVVTNSIFSSEEKFAKFLKHPSIFDYQEDPLVRYFYAIVKTIRSGENVVNAYDQKLEMPKKLFISALKELSTEYQIDLYPEANGTMRYTFGKVMKYKPSDAVTYDYFTTDKGILEKYKPNDPEFELPDSLRKLLIDKDFDQYDLDKILPICFITDNDFTGGSSGSPVINKNGHLIGCAFDGNWEALSNEVVYNTSLQRTICVDIRYILFLIDKYAHADYLIDEMKIIP